MNENLERADGALSVREAPEAQDIVSMDQLAGVLGQMAQMLRGMGDMMRATNERVSELERQFKQANTLTGAQESNLNAIIRNRARALAKDRGLDDNNAAVRAVAEAIRKALRMTAGVRSVRELPRCEYGVCVERVDMWDDFPAMKEIRAKYQR